MVEILVSGLQFAGFTLLILLMVSGGIFILVIWYKYFLSPILDWIESWGDKA